jgi:hypothetical protein
MVGEHFLTFLKGPYYHHHQGQAVRGTAHADRAPLNTEDEGTVTLHNTSNYLPLETV